MKIISKNEYKRSAWKNGLGYTDQIAIYPADAVLAQANFLWRISSARIEKNAPFSLFPAHDRMLVILNGAGITLTHSYDESSEDTVKLAPYEIYEFPGDVPSRCELVDGPITDFSIFLRTAEVDPVVQIVDIKKGEPFDWLADGRWNFAFMVLGECDSLQGILSEGDTFAVDQSEAICFRAIRDAKLLTISLAAL